MHFESIFLFTDDAKIFSRSHSSLCHQWFSTFFDSRHLYLVKEQFGVTPNYNLLVKRHQVQSSVAPPRAFQGTRGLRTTALHE